MLTLPIDTTVVFVDGEGNERDARVIQNTPTGAQYLAFDDEGKHTTLASYSTEALPGTFHMKGSSDNAPAAAPEKKKFAPGKKSDAPAETPAA